MEGRGLADRWRSIKWRLSADPKDSRAVEDDVRQAYSSAAERPWGKHPFPVGRGFAESLGYPIELLDSLPQVAVDAFAGVSNVSVAAPIPSGSKVLDLRCGAGVDSLIAAGRIGPAGLVLGTDFSPAMLARAARSRAQAKAQNVHLLLAQAATLPLKDASIDAALINGIFNLNPSRDLVFRELARVVRPGGFVFAAELVVREPLSAGARSGARSWFA